MVSKIPTRHRAAGHREASARITATLADLSFPKRKDDLVERVGDREIEVAPGETLTLRDMLGRVSQDQFKDAAAVLDALDAQWQEYRADVGAQAPPPPTLLEPGESGKKGRR